MIQLEPHVPLDCQPDHLPYPPITHSLVTTISSQETLHPHTRYRMLYTVQVQYTYKNGHNHRHYSSQMQGHKTRGSAAPLAEHVQLYTKVFSPPPPHHKTSSHSIKTYKVSALYTALSSPPHTIKHLLTVLKRKVSAMVALSQ